MATDSSADKGKTRCDGLPYSVAGTGSSSLPLALGHLLRRTQALARPAAGGCGTNDAGKGCKVAAAQSCAIRPIAAAARQGDAMASPRGRRPADPVTFADWRTARANIAAPRPLEYEGIAIVPAQRMVYRNQMADLRGRTSTANRWSVTWSMTTRWTARQARRAGPDDV